MKDIGYWGKIENLSIEDFYEKIKKPNDLKNFLPLAARVWIDGLEYKINGTRYFLCRKDECVYKFLSIKDIRKRKLEKLESR